MYVLLFTCLNVRAIHLELLPSMDSKNFLLAFKRFCNMYLIPNSIYSDNAKTFIKGGEILSQSLVSEEFTDHLRVNLINHVKIPLYAAWIGSSWERLIRVVKNCMYKTLNKTKLTYFELLTVFSNIKNSVNSRPLTYRSIEGELDIITPNSFLKLHSNSSLVLRTCDDVWVDDECQETLQTTLEKQEEAYEHFRRVWFETYLLSLREHSRNLYQSDWNNRIKVNDVVLIRHPSKPRPYWLLRRVLDLVLGHDNIIRSVRLKQGDGTIAHHSINNLYPLELSITHNPKFRDDAEKDEEGSEDEVSDIVVQKRPPRQAALKCKQLIRDKLDL